MKFRLLSGPKLRRLAVLLVLAAALITYLQRSAVLSGMARWLNVGRRLEAPVDAVLVLGGGVSTRPFVAVEMLRTGLASKILIPQVELTDEYRDGLARAEYDVTQETVLRSGIAPEAVVVLNSIVNSTEQEAQAAANYLRTHPGERMAIVTSDYHTRRVRWLLSRACGEDARNVILVGAPTDGFDASNWWCTEAGTILIVSEYLKLARTLAR